MKNRTLFLDGTFKRSTNLLTAAIAEFTSGWTASGGLTEARSSITSSPFNGDIGATATDWGFAHQLTSAGTSTFSIATTANVTTFGTGVTVVSLYVHRLPPSNAPLRNFKINLQGQTGSIEHSVIFTRSVIGDRWTVTTEVGGAVGRVDPVNLPSNLDQNSGDDVWTRVTVAFAIGWQDAAGAATAAVAGDNFKIVITSTDDASARLIDFWGVHVSQPSNTLTSVRYVETSAFVRNNMLPMEYVVGMKSNAHNGIPPVHNTGWHPLFARASLNEVQTAACSTWMLGTSPDAGVKLYGRAAYGCPWEVLSATVEGDLVGASTPVDTNAVTIVRPEMRLCVTELTTTTTTLGCMLF